jgi:hypothetical protein
MMRIRILGPGFLAVLAACMLLAASASAGEYNLKMLPEIGRCVKVGGGGEYKGARCIRSEPGVGKYNWLSGPGAKKNFSGTLQEPIDLETHGAGASMLNCNSAEAEGEYTGPKNLKVTKLVFHGCTVGGKTCQNEAGSTMGEVSAKELDGELGFISHPKRLKVGWDLKPASGSNLASFECGATEVLGKSTGNGIARELQGSVIGRIEPIDRMVSEYAAVYELKKGAQFPERFEGGVKDTLTTIVGEALPGTGKTSEPSTLFVRDTFKNGEALEVLGKCIGAC